MAAGRFDDAWAPGWPLRALGVEAAAAAAGAALAAADFAAFAAPPTTIQLVVLGQDPYPDAARRTGFAFAFRADGPPAAAKKKRGGAAGVRAPGSARVVAAALGVAALDEAWARAAAARGVLLLNAALTVGARAGSHARAWAPFAAALVAYLERAAAPTWLAWGRDAARALAGVPPGRVLAAGHPSPVVDCTRPAGARFADQLRPHLAAPAGASTVGALLGAAGFDAPAVAAPAVDAPAADAVAAPALVIEGPVYVDGSCAGDPPRCGSAVYAPAAGRQWLVGGPHLPADAPAPLPDGYPGAPGGRKRRRTDEQLRALAEARVAECRAGARPTNNRAEWLAAYWALRLGAADVRSDSRNVVGALRGWIADRAAAGTLHAMENLDLALAAYALYRRGATARHVPAHGREPPRDREPARHADWAGNAEADRLAKLAAAGPDDGELREAGSPREAGSAREAGAPREAGSAREAGAPREARP